MCRCQEGADPISGGTQVVNRGEVGCYNDRKGGERGRIGGVLFYNNLDLCMLGILENSNGMLLIFFRGKDIL